MKLINNCYTAIQNYGERILSQFIGALIMIAIGGGGAFITYLILYLLPIRPVAYILEKYKTFGV
jgi:hypoxanthine phosphoribosyltransferase